MLYTASHTANYFLERAEKEKVDMTLMKLVKLVYIAHGWSLSVLDKPLISSSDTIEAWQYGPVIPSLYHELKHFGSSSFTKGTRSKFFDPSDGNEPSSSSIDEKHTNLTKLLSLVWKLYGKKTGTMLMRLTHQKDTPWSECYNEGERYIRIEDSQIKEHFDKLIKKITTSKDDG